MYRDLGSGGANQVGVVLEYETAASGQLQMLPLAASPRLRPVLRSRTRRLATPVNRLDVIGAGNFARTMLLPHLKGLVYLLARWSTAPPSVPTM